MDAAALGPWLFTLLGNMTAQALEAIEISALAVDGVAGPPGSRETKAVDAAPDGPGEMRRLSHTAPSKKPTTTHASAKRRATTAATDAGNHMPTGTNPPISPAARGRAFGC